MSEKDLMTAIRKRLGIYQACGDVEWFMRINSGKIEQHGHWIQLAPPGTPDWIALIRNKQRAITVLFLEAKSESGRQSVDQHAFQARHHNNEDILYYVIKDIVQLSKIMNTLAFDRTTLLPK